MYAYVLVHACFGLYLDNLFAAGRQVWRLNSSGILTHAPVTIEQTENTGNKIQITRKLCMIPSISASKRIQDRSEKFEQPLGMQDGSTAGA